MPRVRAKPNPKEPGLANGSLPDVLTLSEAAAYLRLPESEVVRLIREQGLPARQVGTEWRFLLTAVRHWLSQGNPPASSKDAWMKLAGVWRDDPTMGRLREEILEQRRRLMSEDQE